MAHAAPAQVKWTAALLVSALSLLLPAILNGFPFVFADTGGYLARPFEGTLALGRSAFYGLFLAAGAPFNFWPNVFIQAAVSLWIIALIFKVHGVRGQPYSFAAVVIGLSALTSLPWYIGQLMPDIFVPLSILTLYLLAFHQQNLTKREKLGLLACLATSIAFHMSILALVAAWLLAMTLLLLVPARWRQVASPQLSWPVLGLIAGLTLAPLSNLAIAGSFAFTPGGTTFLFGRLVQDGIIERYLSEHCADQHIRLCKYRDQMPRTADDWLWSYDSPLHKLGWWRAFQAEGNQIILETLYYYPLEHIRAAAEAAAEQFVHFKSGEGLGSNDNWHAESVFREFTPGVVEAFRASRQEQDRWAFTTLNAVQLPLAWLAIAWMACWIALLPWRAGYNKNSPIELSVFVALILNAMICGIFSNPNDRYQSRIIWLGPLVLAIRCLEVAQRPKASGYAPTRARSTG